MDLFLCCKWKYKSLAAVFAICSSAGGHPAAAAQLLECGVEGSQVWSAETAQQNWLSLLFLRRGQNEKKKGEKNSAALQEL